MAKKRIGDNRLRSVTVLQAHVALSWNDYMQAAQVCGTRLQFRVLEAYVQ